MRPVIGIMLGWRQTEKTADFPECDRKKIEEPLIYDNHGTKKERNCAMDDFFTIFDIIGGSKSKQNLQLYAESSNTTGPRKVSTGIKAEAHFSGRGIVTRRLHQKNQRKFDNRPEKRNVPDL